jgi:hypothetical protein
VTPALQRRRRHTQQPVEPQLRLPTCHRHSVSCTARSPCSRQPRLPTDPPSNQTTKPQPTCQSTSTAARDMRPRCTAQRRAVEGHCMPSKGTRRLCHCSRRTTRLDVACHRHTRRCTKTQAPTKNSAT